MRDETFEAKDEDISRCLQLAILLEIGAYPKPGNVHRTSDFKETRFEQFLASAVAVTPHLKKAAKQGMKVAENKISLSEIRTGKIIKNAVKSVSLWQRNGNTLLGATILLTPIAISAGMLFKERFSVSKLRENLKIVVESSTPWDAVDVYEAISIAQPGGLGNVAELDVNDINSRQRILDEHITLYDVFKIASEYDSIASEWVNNYRLTFDLGDPYFNHQINDTRDINTTTVHTFLRILSEVPDTFITRKIGLAKAKKISAQAKKVLEKGGLATITGRKLLWKLDRELKDESNKLNPGTTADITEAVLAINTLRGYRP